MKQGVLFCMVTTLFFLSGCVEPSQFAVLENRVSAIEMEDNRQRVRLTEVSKKAAVKSEKQKYELQEKLDGIESRLAEGHVISKEEYAELHYHVQTLKKAIQRLEGEIEEIHHRLKNYSIKAIDDTEKKIERLDLSISRNYEKVIRLENYMGFEPTVAGELPSSADSPEVMEAGSEKQQYDAAKKLFDEGDNANARIQFENFINKYPESENADNARFWIADSYYSEKWFEKAILEYQKVFEKYPDSNKLSAARLKQGYAFAELGEKANARLILKELIKKHPNSNEAKYAQEKLNSLK